MKSFDYIIVGAGSAGCVLADKLSAEGQYSVLLVEAGGRDWNPMIHIPAGFYKVHNHPKNVFEISIFKFFEMCSS